MVGVLPRYSATSVTAALIARWRERLVSPGSSEAARAEAAMHGRVPGAEVLGGEVLEQPVEVEVHRRGVQVAPAALELVGEQALGPAAAPPQAVQRDEHLGVVDLDAVLDAGLALEPEDERVLVLRHVPLLEGGQPEGAVGVGVDVAADAEVAEVQQAYGDGVRALQRHPLQPEVTLDRSTGRRELARSRQDAVELHLVALDPPVRVVEVLPPSRVVGADGLDVPVRVRRDPDLLPRGWDRQRLDALDLVGVGDPRRRPCRGRPSPHRHDGVRSPWCWGRPSSVAAWQ